MLSGPPSGSEEELVLRFPLETQGLTPEQRPAGDIVFRRAGEVTFAMAELFMWDSSIDQASGEKTMSEAIDLVLVQEGNQSVVEASIDATWLTDPARVYPVTIDPSIGPREPTLDTFVQSNITSTPQDREPFLKSGYYSGSEGSFTARSLLKFDLSDLPNGSDITAAELNLYNNHSYSCQHRAVEVRRVTESWGANVTWSNRPSLATNVADSINNSLGYSSACAADRLSFDVTSVVSFWKNSSATNYGFGVRAADESDVQGWKRFSSDQGAHPPKLLVDYNLPNTPPSLPNDLEPPDGSVAAEPKPLLRARYRDPDGGSGSVEFRVFNPNGTRRYKKTVSAQAGELKSYTVGNLDDDGNSGQLVEGFTYSWDVRNVDNRGAVSDWTNARSYTVEDEGPTITNLSSTTHPNAGSPPEDNWYNRTTAEFTWGANDAASPIAGYSTALNNLADFDPAELIDTMEGYKGYEPLDEGVRYFHVRAVDSGGNWGPTLSRPVRTDRTNPVIEWVQWWDHPEAEWHRDNDPLIQWLASDTPSGIDAHSYALDAEPDDTSDPVVQPDPGVGVQLTDVSDGEHSFKVKVRDKASNWSPVSSYSLKVDASAPTTRRLPPRPIPTRAAITQPMTWSSTGALPTPTRGWTATPTSSIRTPARHRTTPSRTVPPTARPRPSTTSPPGIHYFHVKARNAAGGFSGVRHFAIRIEGAPGAPEISSPTHPDQESWYSSSEVEFNWTEPNAPSGIAGYSFALDRDSSTTPDETVDASDGERRKLYSDVAEGVSHFHVRARTNAGNWGEPGHFRIQVDSTGPDAPPAVISSSHPPGIGMRDNTVDMTWGPSNDSLSGVASYEYSFATEGSPPDWGSCPSCTTGPDERRVDGHQIDDDGRYTFHVRALDHAGNSGAAANYGPIVIDQNGSIVPLNPSLDNELVAQSDTNGMEQFYPYSKSPLGTASAFTNLYSGNAVVKQPLASIPGKGLNTVLNLTYNSQRSDDYHDTGVGRGWSLSVSDIDAGLDFAGGLTEIDVAAPVVVGLVDVAGGAAGATGGLLELTDGDGTVHRFVREGAPGSRWDSPPGVDLKVRENLDPSDPSGITVASYDLIRPDGVVYRATRNELLTGGGLTDTWHIRSITDRNDNQLIFGYEELDLENLRTLTDVRVETITHKTAQDEERVVAELDYDYELVAGGDPLGSGNLEQVTTLPGPNQRTHEVVIDANDELTSVTRNSHASVEDGRQTTGFGYETYTVEHPVLPAETRLLTSVTDARGNDSRFDYDSATGVWRHDETLDREGEAWTVAYEQADPNSGDRTTVLSSPVGAETSYEISGRAPISDEDRRIAGGNIDRIADDGTLDENGANTGPVELSYDWQENRLVAKRNGVGDETTMTYNDLGLATEIDSPPTNAGGDRVITAFDYAAVDEFSYGDDCGEVPPDGEGDRVTNAMACDTVAELERSTGAQGSGLARASDYYYDQFGNLDSVIARRDAATGHDQPRQSNERQTTMSYNSWGGLETVDGPRIFPAGEPQDITSFPSYHASGQPTEITDATAKNIAVDYGPYGQVEHMEDRAGRDTFTTFDELDRPLTDKSPGGDITSFSYDPNGNSTTVTSARGNATAGDDGDFTTTISYDAMDRPTESSSPGTTSAEPIETSTSYNQDGSVASESNPVGGVTSYGYHPNRMLKETTAPVTGGVTASANLYYDAAGRERKLVAPEANGAGQRPVTESSFTPSGAVARTEATNWQGPDRVVSYSYNPHGEVTEIEGPRSGQLQTQELNAYGEVTSLTTKVSETKTLSYGYDYNLVGQKTAYVQPHGSGDEMTTSFEYDVLGRLEFQSDPQTPGHTTEYSYLPEGQQSERRDYFTPAGGTKQLQRLIETDYNLDYTLRSLMSHDKTRSPEPTLALYNYAVGQGQDPESGYDANGNLLASHSVCSGAGPASGTVDDCPDTGVTLRSESMSYDHADRLDELTQRVDAPGEGEPVVRTQQLTYRKDSTLSSSTWDGHTTSYQHSSGGYLTELTDWARAATRHP